MAATPFSYIRTSPVSPLLCSASPRSNHPKNDPTRHRASSSNWWTPLFGWSSDPDYIVQGTDNRNPLKGEPGQFHSDKEIGRPTARSKFGVGCFTEEKAKELRRKTMETSAFHDIMYHSAIASRLASDVSETGH